MALIFRFALRCGYDRRRHAGGGRGNAIIKQRKRVEHGRISGNGRRQRRVGHGGRRHDDDRDEGADAAAAPVQPGTVCRLSPTAPGSPGQRQRDDRPVGAAVVRARRAVAQAALPIVRHADPRLRQAASRPPRPPRAAAGDADDLDRARPRAALRDQDRVRQRPERDADAAAHAVVAADPPAVGPPSAANDRRDRHGRRWRRCQRGASASGAAGRPPA